jgi:hypothetical protein
MASGKTVYGHLLAFDDRAITLSGDSGEDEIARAEIAKATIEAEL